MYSRGPLSIWRVEGPAGRQKRRWAAASEHDWSTTTTETHGCKCLAAVASAAISLLLFARVCVCVYIDERVIHQHAIECHGEFLPPFGDFIQYETVLFDAGDPTWYLISCNRQVFFCLYDHADIAIASSDTERGRHSNTERRRTREYRHILGCKRSVCCCCCRGFVIVSGLSEWWYGELSQQHSTNSLLQANSPATDCAYSPASFRSDIEYRVLFGTSLIAFTASAVFTMGFVRGEQ